jgi:hypothetical protein
MCFHLLLIPEEAAVKRAEVPGGKALGKVTIKGLVVPWTPIIPKPTFSPR